MSKASEAADVTKKTLAQKLAEVQLIVDRIPKRGRNDFHGYSYATESDIADTVRRELASRGVVLMPAIVEERRDSVGDKGSFLTTLKMEFTWVDAESGEERTRPWVGWGSDKDDKGGYKAATGGEKYFILKSFLIPTGDDPERENGRPDIRGQWKGKGPRVGAPQGGGMPPGQEDPPLTYASPKVETVAAPLLEAAADHQLPVTPERTRADLIDTLVRQWSKLANAMKLNEKERGQALKTYLDTDKPDRTKIDPAALKDLVRWAQQRATEKGMNVQEILA